MLPNWAFQVMLWFLFSIVIVAAVVGIGFSVGLFGAMLMDLVSAVFRKARR